MGVVKIKERGLYLKQQFEHLWVYKRIFDGTCHEEFGKDEDAGLSLKNVMPQYVVEIIIVLWHARDTQKHVLS